MWSLSSEPKGSVSSQLALSVQGHSTADRPAPPGDRGRDVAIVTHLELISTARQYATSLLGAENSWNDQNIETNKH